MHILVIWADTYNLKQYSIQYKVGLSRLVPSTCEQLVVDEHLFYGSIEQQHMIIRKYRTEQ